jgi:spore maturation protein CgeB/GT2 family glycosyltransferase
MQILVFGMHRSGTSAVSRLLNMMGVYFAPEGFSTGANWENPKGFWERRDVRALNDMILRSANADWDLVGEFSVDRVPESVLTQFRNEAAKIILAMDAHRPWFIKEPRLCLLSSLWITLLEVPLCLFVSRSPIEVALSLERRNKFSHSFSLALWERYMVDALNATTGLQRLFVNYDELLANPVRVVKTLVQGMRGAGIEGLRIPAEREVRSFIDPSLYRARENESSRTISLTVAQRRLRKAITSTRILERTKPVALSDAAHLCLVEHDHSIKVALLEGRIKDGEEALALAQNEVEQLKAAREEAARIGRELAAAQKDASASATKLRAAQEEATKKSRELAAAQTHANTSQVIRSLLHDGVEALRTIVKSQTEAAILRGKIQEQTRAINTRQASSNQSIAKREVALAEQRTRIEELTAKNEILRQGLNEIENTFRLLCASRSFHFVVYTARRFGLVKRNTRLWVESIKSQFPSIRKALKQATVSSNASPSAAKIAPRRGGGGSMAIEAHRTSEDQRRLEKEKSAEATRYRQLASGRNRVALPSSDFSPESKVCLIVLHRDGEEHLRKLFSSFLKVNSYEAAEFHVVLHSCRDGSREVIESFQHRLKIKVTDYAENFSFAYSNNRAAETAESEFLLFLNNDVIFQQDVIRTLLQCLQNPCVGLAGLRLHYPAGESDARGAVQHLGIKFRSDPVHFFYRPYNVGAESVVVDSPPVVEKFPAVTAAVVVCRRDDFLNVGGFHEQYLYGYEDVDLALSFKRLLGLQSVSANQISCIHDESSTGRLDSSEAIRLRRANNIEKLVSRHGWYLRRRIVVDKAADRRFYSDLPLTIGFAVTEATASTAAGDFFTASELADACGTEFGWIIRYLSRKEDWYDLTDIDVLVVLIDAYDLSKIRNAKPDLVKVAWLRNWFERWVARSSFDSYDLFLCSSDKATQWIREKKGKPAHLFRLATNPARFTTGKAIESLESDYCFTGSYWEFERDIAAAVDPERVGGEFAVFGRGWEKHPRLGEYARGFIPYRDLTNVYASTRIVIDDANHVTKDWGSVNSRVFDAFVANALVISNGELGAREVFAGELPIYHSQEELSSLLRRYLTNDEERVALVHRLREKVLGHHTYRHRARQLKSLLVRRSRSAYRFAFKIGAPTRSQIHHWGDYHFALSLGRCLAKHGHSFRIDCIDEWDLPESFGDDVVISLRGLSRYRPLAGQINLMWNISHPEKIEDEEYNEYDHVFIASDEHAAKLAKRLATGVSSLLQCTDPEIFYPEPNPELPGERLLFVGNSRKQYREAVRLAVEAGLPIGVYGTHWSSLIPNDFIRGEYIDNVVLRQHYSQCEILLNDHWPSMRESGFISNRIFDGVAAGAFVLTDKAKGLDHVFGDDLVAYETEAEFREVVEYYLGHPEERQQRAERLRLRVLEAHTFAHRASVILTNVRSIDLRKRSSAEILPGNRESGTHSSHMADQQRG